MATFADDGMIQRMENAPRPTAAEQARVNARAMALWQAEASAIGALTELVLLGPPGGAVGAAAWSREVRARLDRFRLAGSLRAENGGAEVLAVLERQIERTEAAAEALLAERG